MPSAATQAAQFGAAGPHVHVQALPAAAMEAAPVAMSRTGWTASASDEEIAGENGLAGNVLDGNAPRSLLHSGRPRAWCTAAPITIDTNASRSVSWFRYLPRSDVPNGRVGSFEVRVSTDGTTWGAPVATGRGRTPSAEKSVTFAAVSARYVRLTATTEAGNRGPWSSAAGDKPRSPGQPHVPPTGSAATGRLDGAAPVTKRSPARTAGPAMCSTAAQPPSGTAGGPRRRRHRCRTPSRSTPRRREASSGSALSPAF